MNSSATRLRLFGTPVVSDADGTPVFGAEQPHRIALLALLALHGNRTATRTELTAWLWPGFDQKEANQLLNKELFGLNKALGDDAIFSNAKEVRLGSRVTVDALEFQAALDEGRPGDAMELYSGPLLDDFVLDDAPEFQGWAADQRARFAAARKSLRPIAEAAANLQPEIPKPASEVAEVAPEVEPPKPRPRRKRPKPAPREEPRPATEPVPEAQPSAAAPSPEAEVPPAPPELPPDIPPAPAPPPLQVYSAADEPSPNIPSASAEPTSDVFWAREAAPEIGRAHQPTSGLVGTSQEMPAPSSAEPPEPESPPDFARGAPPPANFAPESAEPVVWLEPDAAEPAAYVPPEMAEPDVVLPEAPPASEAPSTGRAPTRAVRRRRRQIPLPPARLVVTVLVLALLGGTVYALRGRITDAVSRARSYAKKVASADDRARSIAVLPIAFIGDPNDEVLAAGIGEQIGRMLTRFGLRVTPTEMFAYREPPYDIPGIADTLGVTHVLRGTMQKVDTTVRFRFQLVNAADNAVRWDQSYAPRLADIMVLEEDVAITVARQILEKPATSAPLRETNSGAAYELVLRGSDPALLRSDGGARQGLELFRQAVALDSGYARAWAGLARMYVRTTATLNAADRDRQLALARQAAQRAVTLNDSLAESHAALGLTRIAMFDMTGAETHLQLALQLDSSRAAHESLVDLYLWSGRNEQALALAQRALERDPRSPYTHADVARVLQLMNRCDEAIAHVDQIANAGRLPRAAETRALCHAQAGRGNQAIAAARAGITPDDSSAVSLLAFLLQRAGNGAEAEQLRAVVNDQVRRGRASALDLALLEAGARDFDDAARRVREAIDARSFLMPPGVSYVTLMSPLFQELHKRPEFVAARRRLGYR